MKIITALFSFFVLPSLQGAVLLEYESTPGSRSVTASRFASQISPDALVAGSGLNLQTRSSTFNFSSWDPDSKSFSEAVAANDFWQWGFSVHSSQEVRLTEMALTLDRSGTGPQNVQIFASVNDASPFLLFSYDFAGGTNPTPFSMIDLRSLRLLRGGDAVTFTLGAYNAGSVRGTLDLEPISGAGGAALRVRGEITSVPEPSALLLLAVGGGFLFQRGRPSSRKE